MYKLVNYKEHKVYTIYQFTIKVLNVHWCVVYNYFCYRME